MPFRRVTRIVGDQSSLCNGVRLGEGEQPGSQEILPDGIESRLGYPQDVNLQCGDRCFVRRAVGGNGLRDSGWISPIALLNEQLPPNKCLGKSRRCETGGENGS